MNGDISEERELWDRAILTKGSEAKILDPIIWVSDGQNANTSARS